MKKRKHTFLLLCGLMLLSSLTGCENVETSDSVSDQANFTTIAREEGTFDIDAVRKDINIKGYKFTIPQKLSELEKELTYKYVSDELADGFYKVEISGKNEQILDVVVRAKKKNDKNAVIDNIAVETSDSNVCGLIPLVTAKDEVIEKFGEPNEQKTEIIREEKEFFYYGIEEYDDGYLNIRAKMMTVCFNKDKIVETITITYSN